MTRNKRLEPGWFDHSRVPLVQLRSALDKALEDWVPSTPGGTVLDIGCGDCPYKGLFEAKGMTYVGCDLEAPADVLIEPHIPIALPDGCADVVVSFQVLEHVWELDWYLGECRRLLKPGGRLMLSTHGVWLYHPHPGDYRRWTRTGLVRELEEAGFTVPQTIGLVGPLAWTTEFRLLGWREALSRIPVLGRILMPIVALIMNLRMAVEEAVTPQQTRDDHACIYLCLCTKEEP